MTATNHAATGAVIGAAIGQWWALPLAFLAHFVLDALPHYGNDANGIESKQFARILYVDLAGAVLLALVIAVMQPQHWVLIDFSAFLCISPDLMWLPEYVRAKRGVPQKPRNIWQKLHGWVQWYQKPRGKYLELSWLAAMLVSLAWMLS